jgi:orotidine-5'-phosphate decarboxylase
MDDIYTSNAREKLIVALDFASENQARTLVSQLGDTVGFYKVGKELFTAVGPSIVRELVGAGKKVFLDLKFHDIPNTVAGAVRSASALGVSLLTVHASGGSKMLQAAAKAAAESPSQPTVLAVTVLTSLAAPDLDEIGITATVEAQVLRLATLALNAGCGGIVASAQEAARLRESLGTSFTLVTPGIRPAGSGAADQARVVTPEQALRSGSDYLVIGRPITAADSPASAAHAILQQIQSALSADVT